MGVGVAEGLGVGVADGLADDLGEAEPAGLAEVVALGVAEATGADDLGCTDALGVWVGLADGLADAAPDSGLSGLEPGAAEAVERPGGTGDGPDGLEDGAGDGVDGLTPADGTAEAGAAPAAAVSGSCAPPGCPGVAAIANTKQAAAARTPSPRFGARPLLAFSSPGLMATAIAPKKRNTNSIIIFSENPIVGWEKIVASKSAAAKRTKCLRTSFLPLGSETAPG